MKPYVDAWLMNPYSVSVKYALHVSCKHAHAVPHFNISQIYTKLK